MQPARRRIEPPAGMDPAVARFIEALARSAARRDKAGGKETDKARKRVLIPPAEAKK